MTERQLRLTRPRGRRPRVERLTGRQRDLLAFVRDEGVVTTRQVGDRLQYAAPSAALDRLERRGLVEHATHTNGSPIRGQWRATRHDERKA